MREDSYLKERLEQIWRRHFSDVKNPNMVDIKFGRKGKKRLGSIQQKPCPAGALDHSCILVNGYFRDPAIPDFVVDATIAHELCHYVHGFSSPLPQAYQHPHRGKVVEKELSRRGLMETAKKEWAWLQQHWPSYVKLNQTQRVAY